MFPTTLTEVLLYLSLANQWPNKYSLTSLTLTNQPNKANK